MFSVSLQSLLYHWMRLFNDHLQLFYPFFRSSFPVAMDTGDDVVVGMNIYNGILGGFSVKTVIGATVHRCGDGTFFDALLTIGIKSGHSF